MNRLAALSALACIFALGCDPAVSSQEEPEDAAVEQPAPEDDDPKGDDDSERPRLDAMIAAKRDGAVEVRFDASDPEEPTAAEDGGMALQDAAQGDGGRGSFETAQRIQPDQPRMLVDERRVDQVDFFVFHAEAGQYYEISTDDGRYSPDNLLAIYDASGKLLAENDDGSRWPGDKFDTRLLMRAPVAGDYVIRIEDLKTEEDFFSSSFPLLYYYLEIRTIGSGTVAYAENVSGQVIRDYQVDGTLPYRYLTVYGQLEGGRATVDIEGAAAHALIARVHPGGVHGNGSTVERGRAFIRAADGHKVAEIDRSHGIGHIRPPLSTGNYQVSIQAEGDVGPNPFFAMDLVLLPDNPTEQNEANNGRARSAELVKLSNGSLGRALVLSRLPPGDVDYYRVDVQANSLLVFSCEGESTGSGVRGLFAEFRDGSDKALSSAKEGDDGLVIEALATTAGAYYLRLSSETASNEVEPWVRCVIFVD